jgi:DNA-binding transcriptional MerR regulator
MDPATSTIGRVARLAGVSVRTLHHYDEMGLVCPARRSAAGYRLYGAAELERLQQVLFFKELGFPLAEIRRVMLDPAFDRGGALRAQRALLVERARRAWALLAAVDAALQALEKGTSMNHEDMFEALGGFDPSQYEDEVVRRWGETDAYRQSARRTATFTKDDWAAIRREEEEITAGIAERMERGPADAEVQELVARRCRHINERFYECSPAMFAGLGEMYVADSRFARNYEKVRPGLAEFLREAMRLYADALER